MTETEEFARTARAGFVIRSNAETDEARRWWCGTFDDHDRPVFSHQYRDAVFLLTWHDADRLSRLLDMPVLIDQMHDPRPVADTDWSQEPDA
jgi:hypothetical protein